MIDLGEAERILLESSGDRAGNVGRVVLIFLGILLFLGFALICAFVSGWLFEKVWPLWAAACLGLFLVGVGYVADAGRVMGLGVGTVVVVGAVALLGATIGDA